MALQLALGCVDGVHRECCGDCTCLFDANFFYPFANASDCLLVFRVSDIQIACTPIDYLNADITVEFELNGTPISAQLVPFNSSGQTGAIAEWWKPTAGDVYTATVTLNCASNGGVGTFTRSYTFTIPDPANIDCSCCNERDIDYVVVSGLTGHAAVVNGTYAISRSSGSSASCRFNPNSGPANPGFPDDPCGLLNESVIFGSNPTAIHQCDGFDTRWHFYPGTGGLSAIQINASTLSLRVTYTFNVARYRWTRLDGCEQNVGQPNCNVFACQYVGWEFTSECNSGRMTNQGVIASPFAHCDSFPHDGSVPTVDVVFVDL